MTGWFIFLAVVAVIVGPSTVAAASGAKAVGRSARAATIVAVVAWASVAIALGAVAVISERGWP